MTIEDLEKILKEVWCVETSSEKVLWNCNGDNPAEGQCAPTALIVQDFFGGALLFASLKGSTPDFPLGYHCWNRLPNKKEVDLTRNQFSEKKSSGFNPGKLIKRHFLFRFCKDQDLVRRYIILRSLVDKELLKKKNIEKSGQGDR